MPGTTAGITKRPDVCGGDACIEGHRVPVWVLVGYQRLGLTDTKILEAYPSLSPADLEAAWEYAAAHRQEIDQAIAENEAGEEGEVG